MGFLVWWQIITNIWIQAHTGFVTDEFWYIDYEKGMTTRSNQKPKNESIRKWNSSIEDFLKARDFNPEPEKDGIIKFKV